MGTWRSDLSRWGLPRGSPSTTTLLIMQPTATMATAAAATTTATVALTTTWDNATDRPTSPRGSREDHHLPGQRCPPHPRLGAARFRLISVSLSPRVGAHRRVLHPEFRGEDPEGQDTETQRFLSTSSTGRRVSFNEAALFEQSRKAQDKGRRYTLTEGDFHHLKNARLTHLHLPPLKIVTIHECDSGEASATATPHSTVVPKASLAIFQPPGKALTGRSVGPSSALPGDPYNSAVGPANFGISPSASSDSGEGSSLDTGARSAKPGVQGAAAGPGEAGPGSGAGPVLQFFTRLRRHASLDGASPYFKVKKWKLEPSQRASSLDTRGSPKRHHFQRQRAASESMEQEEGDAPHVDFIQYIASAGDTMVFPSPRPFLASPTSPPPSLGRLEAAEEVGAAGGASPESPLERGIIAGPEQLQDSDGERDAGLEQAPTIYRDIWSLRASLELHAAASSDHSSSGNDRDSVRSGDSSGSGSGGAAPVFPPPSPPPTPMPRPADGETGGPRKLLQMDSGYASIEGRGVGDDGPPSAPEKRSSFTSAGREATVGCSFESPAPETPVRPRSPRAWPRRAPRRDYSIDEKTDALFHEFLRHDPHFDDALSATARHRARAHPHPHARKQWQQRGRQHSDPGARAAPPTPSTAQSGAPRPARAPLRRGDSVDCPPDGRAGDDPATSSIPVIEEEPGGGCPGSGLCAGTPGALLDKLAASLDDRLFPPRLAQPVAVAPALATAAPTSPDHSPV
ncbi:voltage-dependent calcium channel beta subunit-associated regulatory protein isoform X2 [Bos indicus x Bos taurus]|uniref:voltage-dependent calcium channel beta subunit-associated regulatory protein isoform X2 n=1 Tax=Bos indicus x Bos taurus TaxID=30522 RepID=UPI000F7D324C|nr:voltage-dependent calcium channel beta subunit-associated regulatory protein isoform X2 [Bos indicus x Bos taurus]